MCLLHTAAMMAKLRPIAHGMALAGAGGGGFLCMISKTPHAADTVKGLLAHEIRAGATVHTAAVDPIGLVCELVSEGSRP